MIISASRRTDIPAFYSEWLINRIKEGYFYRVNPFNPRQIKKISLLPDDVDVFVFWSKNPEPLIKQLSYLDLKNYLYYFQFTLNDYPKVFEPGLPVVASRIETFKRLSNRLGAGRIVWRYDPVIISDITPIEYHIKKFELLARQLSEYTLRVTISFVNFYKKVERRWKNLDMDFIDTAMTEAHESVKRVAENFKKIADDYGLEITSCAEKPGLEKWGIKPGSCIDINLINREFGIKLNVPKDRNQRENCLCVKSVDMGMYNTCKHQCSYCYANFSRKTIEANMAKHDIQSPVLIGHVNCRYL